MIKEYVVKVYEDENGTVTSTKTVNELTRCGKCNQSQDAQPPFVRYCAFWNRIVPYEGFCYLGNGEVKI